MRTTTSTAVLLAALLLAGCGSSHNRYGGSVAAPHRQQRVFVLDASGPVDISVETQRGRVSVAPHGTPLPDWIDATDPAVHTVATDTQVLVVAVVQSEAAGRPERARLEPAIVAGRLDLKAEWPARLPTEHDNPRVEPDDGVEYVVRAPTIRAFHATTNWGDVHALGMRGDASIRTDVGDVYAHEHGGTIRVVVDVGDVRLSGLTGAGHVEAEVGDVHVHDHRGPLRVTADVGDIDVTLSPDNPGPVQLVADVGDVRLRAGPALRGEMEFHADVGDVTFVQPIEGVGTVDIRSDTYRLVRGTGGEKSFIRTDVGDIVVDLEN